MRTVSYLSVMKRIAGLHGLTLAAPGQIALEQDVRKWCNWIQEALESAWAAALLVENSITEQRYYWQGLWTAKVYASGDRVYHADTALWYDANAATIDTDVPGVSSKWDVVDTDSGDPFPRKLLVDDGVNTEIPEVIGCWAKNPELYPTTPQIVKPLTVDDAHWFGESASSTSVWVKYRKPIPTMVEYDAERAWDGETLPAVYQQYIRWFVMALSYMDRGQIDKQQQAERKAGAVLDIQIMNQIKGKPNKPFRRRGYGA